MTKGGLEFQLPDLLSSLFAEHAFQFMVKKKGQNLPSALKVRGAVVQPYLMESTQSHIGGPPVIHRDEDAHRKRPGETRKSRCFMDLSIHFLII